MTRAFSVLLLATLSPSTALASGYFYSDSGVVASTRGGAWVAGANTRFAQRYNPAGLIRIDRPTLDLGVSFVQQNVSFQRAGEDFDGNRYATVKNQAAPFTVPEFGYAMPVGDKFAFAFGLYTPYAPSSDYDPEGPQRYTVIDTLILQGNIGPSFAWQPVEQFTLGVGLQWGFLSVGQRLNANVAVIENEAQDDVEQDIAVDVRVQDLFTPSANIGVLIDPVEAVSIGLMFQPPTGYKARGAMTFDASESEGVQNLLEPNDDGSFVWTDEAVALNLALPLEFRAGVAVRPIPDLEIEVAAHYVNWGSVDEILIEEIDVTVGSVIGDQTLPDTIGLPAAFKSSTTYSLGAEGKIGDVAMIRGGGFYEPTAVRRRNLAVGTIDMNKVQLGIGGSVLAGDNLRFDVAANMLFFPETTVNNSEVQQINALNTENDPSLSYPSGLIVGNGTYNSNGWTVGVGASWAFGKPNDDDETDS